SAPRPADAGELRRRIDAGEWVVDLRQRRAFARSHLTGSISVELGDPFATYLAWTIPWGTPLTLIGESPGQVTAAQLQLTRVGIDRLAAAAAGATGDLAGGGLSSYEVRDFPALAAAWGRDGQGVLDVRRPDEAGGAPAPWRARSISRSGTWNSAPGRFLPARYGCTAPAASARPSARRCCTGPAVRSFTSMTTGTAPRRSDCRSPPMTEDGMTVGDLLQRWVKVIDQDKCIGCHACTTACKSENEVPLGVTRTYVKSVEVGTFPQVRRAFQ